MATSNAHMSTHATHTSFWAVFAGSLMIFAGFYHAIAGFIALFKPDLYVASASQLWVMDYSQWGWTHILIGTILLLSAASLFAGKMWGKAVAITLATLSALANFAFLWASPFWSALIIAMDVLIILGVIKHGRDENAYE